MIVDSEGMQLEAVNTVLAPYNVQLDPKQWSQRCVGHKARDFLPGLLPVPPTTEELGRLLAAKSVAYQAIVLARVPVARPGIRELTERARERGYRCGVASATPAVDLEHILGMLGWTGLLDLVLSSDAVPRPKPAPDVYLRAAELSRCRSSSLCCRRRYAHRNRRRSCSRDALHRVPGRVDREHGPYSGVEHRTYARRLLLSNVF